MAVRGYLGIWVWLAAFAGLIVKSSGAASANDGHGPAVHSLNDYLAGGILGDPLLGITLREDRRRLKSGASATGLLIMNIRDGSPAANAGLVAIAKTPKQTFSRIVAVGALVFPPAIVLLPIAVSLPDGVGGDLIIAADGSRVRNYVDYQNEIRNAQFGEIIYLTIVRRGVRMQLAVPIPAMGK